MGQQALRPAAVPLREIALVFSRIGISSFGGGLVAWIYREAVERRRWLPDREFLSGLALSQVLPGANMVNLALYLGMQLRGGWGALAAVLGLLALPILVIIAMFEIYARLRGLAAAHFILDGIATAALGLNIATGVKAMRRSTDAFAVAIALAVFLAVGVLRWPMLAAVLGLAPVSIALAWRAPHG
ncbi:MAG TPA: chromate transporter [Stellaceae bacterium]|nr:chromate transporter [Stellaceae bacterium]